MLPQCASGSDGESTASLGKATEAFCQSLGFPEIKPIWVVTHVFRVESDKDGKRTGEWRTKQRWRIVPPNGQLEAAPKPKDPAPHASFTPNDRSLSLAAISSSRPNPITRDNRNQLQPQDSISSSALLLPAPRLLLDP
ncbi:hypothetical protein NQZ68_004151 [Dissostichus eleginoides]|nr:hypothetical protein NQZ68_004151 [Dissostichus eleginoides]